MTTITYKTILAEPKPYQTKEKDNYLTFLKSNQDKIYSGEIGVYLGRRINIDDQNLYFPFIDIDGDEKHQGNEKIASAILNTSIVYESFQKIGVHEYFYIIATGNSGFRMAANILLNEDDYRAFVEFMKKEMPFIKDLQPTEDLEMPHQLFVYKGLQAHNTKQFVDRHSIIIPGQMFENNIITHEEYKKCTKGKPDPEAIIRFMDRFLNFRPVSDLNSLGKFGKKLKDYRKVVDDIKTKSIINLARYREKRESISLKVMQEKLLKEKNIRCNISTRGPIEALSFKGLPCPACKETTVNAYAYPPHYSLRCFNSDCPANKKGGLSLIEWGRFHASNKEINLIVNEVKRSKTSFNKNNDLFLNAPTKFESLEDVRAGIWKELENDDDVLFLLTPGIGKTRTTLEYLAKNMTDKLIIYSCLNKRQRDEAFKDIKSLSDKIQKDFSQHHENFHLLESREDLCHKKNQLKEITKKGCSPTQILCKGCEYRKTCDYYKQREKINTGIYFVTHRMLQYLVDIIPNPDLIILDEDLLKGFLSSDGCTDDEMEDLAIILDEEDYSLIEQISILGQKIGRQIKREPKSYPVILNWRKQPDSKYYLLDDLATKNDQTEDEIITGISNIISKFKKYSQRYLYEKGININALTWLKGLISDNHHCSLYINEKGKIYFNVKYITSLNYQNVPLKALDATGIKRVVEIITGRDVKIFKSDVKWDSRRIHIKRDTSQNVLKKIKDRQLRIIIDTALKNMSSKNILLITPAFLEERVLKIFKDTDKDRNYKSHHFFGSRGVNDYKDCDGVIVIGSPYPNITSAWNDAQIIYPNDDDMETRNYWPYSLMLLELLQCIHRIRPVNNPKDKDDKEIVIVCSGWPGIIEKPDIIIDQSQNKYWKELAIQRLEPYVKEFGFLNPDIGFLANIYVESRKNVAKKFQNNIKKLTDAYDHIFKSHINFKVDTNATNRFITGKDEKHLDEKQLEKYKWIFILKNTYIQKFTCKNIELILRIKNLLDNTHDIPIFLSNNKQWHEIKDHFKKKYQHFEKFRIKRPKSSGGQKVNGVGNKQSVINFYRQINQFKIFGDINLDSYETIENRIISVDPIPSEFVVVYIPDVPDYKKLKDIVYIGFGSNIIPVSTDGDLTKFKDVFNNLIENKTVITNNGKQLAKILIHSGLINRCEINDVVMNERIIRNGAGLPEVIKSEDLFKKYELFEDTDLSLLMPQLYKVWECQQKIVDDHNLRNILKLENNIIWITANIELTGIYIDVVKMLEYQEEIELKLPREYKTIDRYFKLAGDDYRIRDEINQLGTVTGRFYYELQKVKKDGPMRSFFKARNGYKFVIADYSQHEPRILFGLANDKKNIEAVKSGRDIYVEFIMSLTGKSEQECKELRNIGKQLILSLINGKSLFSLYDDIRNKIAIFMDYEAFKEFIEDYYSDIFTWRKRIARESRAQGYITIGRRRNVTIDTRDPQLFNFPIQGTGADGFKMALIKIDERLRNMDAQIVHIIHDEIIVEARSEDVENVAVIMKDSMEKSLSCVLPDIEFKVEPIIRETWGILN